MGQHEINKGSEQPGDDTSSRMIEGMRAGDKDAWCEFDGKYKSLVQHWCNQAGLSFADSEDVFQEVLRSLQESIKRYAPVGGKDSFPRYLYAIVDRRITDFRRNARKRPTAAGGTENLNWIENSPAATDETTDSLSLLMRDVKRLAKIVEHVKQKVSSVTWNAFWMMTVEGYTSSEAGSLLNISANAVRLARARVRQLLRSAAEQLGDSSGSAAPA
jgi:RNA polymerase sigma factor (sigma-70 family)